MSRRVAFLVPHEAGCMNLATGETHTSVEPVREYADHVLFNIMGEPHD